MLEILNGAFDNKLAY